VFEARGKRKQCEEAINETTARAKLEVCQTHSMANIARNQKPKTENPEKPEACGI